MSSGLNESCTGTADSSSRNGSFLSTLLDELYGLPGTVFSSAVSGHTMSDAHMGRRDIGTPGILIRLQTGRFRMAYEDAERGVEVQIRVCNPCYIQVAKPLSHDLETFNEDYRGKNGKYKKDLIPSLVQDSMISEIGGSPSCLHGLLYENAKDCPENPPWVYCLWRIDDTFDPKSQDIQGLRMLACHRDLQELKKTALGYRLTEVQKAYIRGFVGVSSKR